MVNDVNELVSEVEQLEAKIAAGGSVTEKEMETAIVKDEARRRIARATWEREEREERERNQAECLKRSKQIGEAAVQLSRETETELIEAEKAVIDGAERFYKAWTRNRAGVASIMRKIEDLERFAMSPSSTGVTRFPDGTVDIGDGSVVPIKSDWPDSLQSVFEKARFAVLKLEHDAREGR